MTRTLNKNTESSIDPCGTPQELTFSILTYLVSLIYSYLNVTPANHSNTIKKMQMIDRRPLLSNATLVSCRQFNVSNL